MSGKLKPNGELVHIGGHRIHVFRYGKETAPRLIFMAGSGTVAPVYDFKCLYEKLSSEFRIIVIEKPGYGYSDIFPFASDIDSLVSLQRDALDQLNEHGPYVLVPHSMAGLEALRWKQQYPDEVRAIIGIDMGTPLTYNNWTGKEVQQRIRMMNTFRRLKIHWLLNVPPLISDSLTGEEISQQKLLRKRNAFNPCYCNEASRVLSNAETVRAGGDMECPVLLFVSDGSQNSRNWVESQKKFASDTNAKLVQYDCGHYIHHFKSDEMCAEIKKFIPGRMNLVLIKAGEKYRKQISGMMDEWTRTGEKIVPYAIRKTDYHDFEKYVASLEVAEPQEGLVPDSTYFCLDADRDMIVGAVNIRHCLNEQLLLNGGHIGVGIRPSERKKGYATKMIALALEKCRELGIRRVLMVCDRDNVGSAKSIINNGGVLENEIVVDGVAEQRYWINIT